MPEEKANKRRHNTSGNSRVDESGDRKDMKIAGCPVHVTYHANPNGTWIVQGAVQCGAEDQRTSQIVTVGPHPDRDTGEKDLFDRIATLLGRNEDRNTSRIKNWA
ncbi:MAG TPA: hypothetical protein VLA99_15990 [Nitrospiraceae bacterium]|nr:hypothetical protein [Nitrospiraceae bacterium]